MMLKNGKGLLITFVFVSAVTCLGLAAASGVFAQATAAEETRVFECRDRPKDLATPPRRDPAGPKNPNGKETTVEASGAARAKPLCPDGQLPFPHDLKAPKGNPYFSGTGVDAPYNYAGAWASAGGSIPQFDGGGVVTIVENPAISAAASIHSLFEIAVQGGTGNGDIVEIGWRKRSGDASPRLFVFHWEDWNPGCYNGCGWVQWNPSIVPGMVVNAGTESYMGWVYYEGNWWAWYANQWVGYFPETLWAGGYNKANLVQWFGEVHESDPTPETDMGNGLRAALAAAARFWYPCKVDAAAWVCWIDSTPSLTTLSVPWYTVQNVGGSAHRFGGPGGRAGAGVDP
jgi:hypothetical protein